ncbi:hypothetical protein [Streptomyces sp. NPDC059533]|uniref:hypothetical protein n=2 Tax=unclassified Streptomyces TaxID=2593676 RepID=UPI0036BBBA40
MRPGRGLLAVDGADGAPGGPAPAGLRRHPKGRRHTPTAKPVAGVKGKDGCPTPAKGHKLIWFDHVEGAMADVIAKDAKVTCDTAMGEGAFYRPDGGLKTYAFDPNAKVAVLGKNGPEARPATNTDKTLSGIGHVKECADPEQKHSYDVVVGPGSKITEMAGLSGSDAHHRAFLSGSRAAAAG